MAVSVWMDEANLSIQVDLSSPKDLTNIHGLIQFRKAIQPEQSIIDTEAQPTYQVLVNLIPVITCFGIYIHGACKVVSVIHR